MGVAKIKSVVQIMKFNSYVTKVIKYQITISCSFSPSLNLEVSSLTTLIKLVELSKTS